MSRVYIADLKNHVGQKVTLKGWVYNFRSSGKIKFLLLRDGTGLCQCVYFRGECDEAALELFAQLNQETSVAGRTNARDHRPIHRISDYPKRTWHRFLDESSSSLAALKTTTRYFTSSRRNH